VAEVGCPDAFGDASPVLLHWFEPSDGADWSNPAFARCLRGHHQPAYNCRSGRTAGPRPKRRL